MNTLWPSPAELDNISDHQREQYALAMAGPVGILGGGPGRGKTWLVAQLVKRLIANYGASHIAICAPTGKAAQRANELLIEHNISSIKATTIHRLLQVRKLGYDGNGWGFEYGKEKALPYRFVIIDESSMLDITLLSSLLAASRPGMHVLFVGDFAQLAPVGHGAPLRDMIAAGLPFGELTEPRRNGGDIVRACDDVIKGLPYRPSPVVDIQGGHNLQHIETERPAQAIAYLRRLIESTPPNIDPMWDVQVICATNESGEVNRKSLNTMLQGILNPTGEKIATVPFRMGDKVFCTSNSIFKSIECPYCNYGEDYIEWTGKSYHCRQCTELWGMADMPQDFCANGEIGKVVYLHDKRMHVQFDSPARTLLVLSNDFQAFDLAYAITCHKFQGSQAPYIIIMCDAGRGADMVTSYEWHRTAWSRAQHLCVTIGRIHGIHRQCRKSALKGRKTFLREMLEGRTELARAIASSSPRHGV